MSEKKLSVPEGHISFLTFLDKILKQVHPDTGITGVAKGELNAVVYYIGKALADKAEFAARQAQKSTVTSREIQTAVKLVIPGELAKHAISEGTKAVTKWSASKDQPGKRSLAMRAGLQIPPARAGQYFKGIPKKGKKIKQSSASVGTGAKVYLAAVLEYLAAEILELAGIAARDVHRQRIKVRQLFLAVETDEELKRLFTDLNITMAGAGVVPHIEDKLLEKSKKKKTSKKAPGTPRKKRPGTLARQEVRKQQKQTECFMLSKEPFRRLVKEIAQDFGEHTFSDKAMTLIQTNAEGYLVKLLEGANQVAVHADRKRVEPKDIALVRRMRGETLRV